MTPHEHPDASSTPVDSSWRGGPIGLLVWLVRRVVAEVRWRAGNVGYRVRPYDQLADARRWFWQPAGGCRPLVLSPEASAELARALMWPGNDGQPIGRDPSVGRIDRDIQWRVHDEFEPSSLGQRVALENTLQELRRKGRDV